MKCSSVYDKKGINENTNNITEFLGKISVFHSGIIMNYITRFIRAILELFFWDSKTANKRKEHKSNNDLNLVEAYLSEIEEKKAIDARIEAQKREKQLSMNNTGTMDEI